MKNLLKAVGIFCLCGIAFSIFQVILTFTAHEWTNSLPGIYTLQALSLIVVFGLSAYWGIRATEHTDPLTIAGFRTPLNGKSALLVIGLAIVAIPLVSYTEQLNKQLPLPDVLQMMEDAATALTERLMNTHSVWQLIANILIIGGVPAICEEIMFRGWIQRRLTESMNHHLGIWIAALIFSAIHMQFLGFVPRMLLGAVLGYAYYYTGSIWASALIHFTNNSLAAIAGFLIYNNVLPETDTTLPFAIASLALSIAFLFYLSKVKSVGTGEVSGDRYV